MDELREALSERLRLVFDFATLEAYADTEADAWEGRTASGQTVQAVARKCRDGARATRPPAQVHAQAAVLPCDDARKIETQCSASRAKASAGSRRATSPVPPRRRRAGEVQLAPQPCLTPLT